MLTSLQNTTIKEIRKLHRSKERHRQNLLLLEGTNLLTSALESNYPLETVCCTPDWQENYPELWQQLEMVSQHSTLVSPDILKSLATTVNPDGIVATAPRKLILPNSLSSREISREMSGEVNLALILERLQDPGNLGTIIRTAVASQVDGLWLSQDCVDVDNPKVLRASAGEWFRMAMGVSPNLLDLVGEFQSQGFRVIATSASASKSYWEIDFSGKCAIVLGNEGGGISDKLLSRADDLVSIPVFNGVESLNVGISAALLLYEVQRQRLFNRDL